MKILLDRYQIIVLGMYLFFNTYACFYLLHFKKTFGDFEFKANNIELIFYSYFMTIIPFIIFCFFIYPYIQNKFVSKLLNLNSFNDIKNKMLIFVFILQLSFLIFNLYYGINVAGSYKTADNYLKYLFIIFSPDLFFIIFYGFARDHKYFNYNLFLYLVSNISRGWYGPIFFIFVLEFYRYLKNNNFKKNTGLFVIVLFILVLLPYFILFKEIIRGYFGHNEIALKANLEILQGMTFSNYIYYYETAIKILFGRFQFLSNVYLILDNYDSILFVKNEHNINSIFFHGLPQQFFFKMLHLKYSTINTFLAQYFTGNFNESIRFNIHIGWIGYAILEKKFISYIFLYSLLLIFLVVYLNNKIGGKYMQFIGWFFTLIFLCHGWLEAYISYICSLITFLFILKAFNFFHLSKINKKVLQ